MSHDEFLNNIIREQKAIESEKVAHDLNIPNHKVVSYVYDIKDHDSTWFSMCERLGDNLVFRINDEKRSSILRFLQDGGFEAIAKKDQIKTQIDQETLLLIKKQQIEIDDSRKASKIAIVVSILSAILSTAISICALLK
ncbi:hypothetical protein [Chryseobacterium indologenes]|uniref:hypothetical protein n=1 Tax=Chryseobacterium indologenes TaxID=253 RepID=UPI001BCF4CDB|nr:hypothetical protein [Chryseobacterium indologenes]